MNRVARHAGSGLIVPTGRRARLYTVDGILRMACWRCGRRAWFQWFHRSCAEALATGHRAAGHYRPLCIPCDVEQNRMVLEFYGDPDVDAVMAAYLMEAWGDAHVSAYCAEFPGDCPHCDGKPDGGEDLDA